MNRAGRLRTYCVLFCWLAAAIAARDSLANGGVFQASAVHRTGNLVPMEKRLISLETEELVVRMEGDDADVHVTYLFLNHGPEDFVTFGFPIDVATQGTFNTPNGYDWVMSNSIRDFKVVVDDKPVPVEQTVDKPLSAKERPPGIDPQITLVRRWSMMTLKFAGEKRQQLRVSYKVRCIALDKGFEGETLWEYGLRTLFYTFHPAATWGNGHVEKLSIILDTRQLSENDVPITQIIPPGGIDENGLRRWEFKNVNLAKFSDLTLRYDPTDWYRDRDVRSYLLGPESIKSLEVSSSLKADADASYGKESMRDRDVRTAWVEGARGPGIGETIIFKPKDAYVTEIGILNGYVADSARYYANARIKKLRVEVEFQPSEDSHEPPEPREQRDIVLPDRGYKSFKPRYPFSSVDWIVQHGSGNDFISKVTLTILEVYPGRKFEDTAIAELYICGGR